MGSLLAIDIERLDLPLRGLASGSCKVLPFCDRGTRTYPAVTQTWDACIEGERLIRRSDRGALRSLMGLTAL
jgi:hypothetical protein